MLLSIPTWIIHISSMVEWGLAVLFLYQYGQALRREDIKKFARLMLPHWTGGWCVIAFHLTNDTVLFWLDASKVINLIGSLCLLYGSIQLLQARRARPVALMLSTVAVLMAFQPIQTFPELYWRAKVIDAMFQLSSLIYFVFLVSLLFVYRRDKTVFSPITVFGFWFVLLFVVVTVVCMHFSKLRGYPTLTHDDVLHGFSESLLTLSNLLVVIGIQQQRKQAPAIGNLNPIA